MKRSPIRLAVASVATALAAGSVMLPAATNAAAASPYCTQATPNTSILFYKRDSGEAVTGTLAAGRWQHRDNLTGIPAGYTHTAASRDTLVFYNATTGAWQTGTFKDGVYATKEKGNGFATGWTHVEAAGDSVLFYNDKSGKGATGTLKNGLYREVRAYDNFSTGWQKIAGSCDTMAFAKNVGHGDIPIYELGYGTLKDGIYTQVGFKKDPSADDLIATKDSLFLRLTSYSGDSGQVATMTDGSLGDPRENGSSGHWDVVGRTADSLFFYKTDGTAWSSTLSGGAYANVGSIIEGGV